MAEEAILQGKILNDLRSFGKFCVCFKIMKSSDNGTPDIFFTTFKTGAVLIETKREDGKASKLQESTIEKLQKCGCRAFKCHSIEEWVAIKAILGIDRSPVIMFE